MGKVLDLTGQRFGSLTAIEWTGVSIPTQGRVWLCKCDCGNYREVTTNKLREGYCHQCEECKKRSKQANMANARLYHKPIDKLRTIWKGIKYRCLNPGCKSYPVYGGRGITICQEWITSYKTFQRWALSNGYKEGLSIDRIDVNGNYCPENCRWITLREQIYNRRNSLYFEYKNKKIPLSLFVYEFELSYNAVIHFLDNYVDNIRSTTNL